MGVRDVPDDTTRFGNESTAKKYWANRICEHVPDPPAIFKETTIRRDHYGQRPIERGPR